MPPGETLAAIGPLPVAALRLAPEEVATLHALGLRRVLDVAALPRADLARRVGQGVGRRLDQALGRVSEPVSPARPPLVFALRLTFPEPIGREEDILAGLDRLLPPLCARLSAAGRGARQLRLALVRTDGRVALREVGLARPTDRPETLRSILALRLGDVDAGFGIEMLRLEATRTEPLAAGTPPATFRGRRAAPTPEEPDALGDLLGRVGARLGLETLVRLHPADSHLPEKAAIEMAAAFAPPAGGWPLPAAARPILLFAPEPLVAGRRPPPPGRLRLAPPAAPPDRRLRPGADRPGMVARRPRLALRPARLLAGRDRGRDAPVDLRGPRRRDRPRLVRPRPLPVTALPGCALPRVGTGSRAAKPGAAGRPLPLTPARLATPALVEAP